MNKTTPDSPARNASGHLTRPEVILGLGILVLAVVARFMPRSGLWLDEALSVNISTESLGDIGTRLRADGHPPLYYALLHFWTNLGGTGDWWVRALSGVISVIGIPLAWLAGRRLFESPESSLASPDGAAEGGLRSIIRTVMTDRTGMYCAVVYAVLPFGVRYASETRMYSLVMVLVLLGVLAVDRACKRPNVRSGVAVAAVAAALLWTHYWSMWLLAAVGLLACISAWRNPASRRAATVVIGGLVGGGIAFLPWLGALMYQSAHTGTPWGDVFRPATMFIVTLVDFAGGSIAETQLLSYLLAFIVVLALWARPWSPSSASEPSALRAHAPNATEQAEPGLMLERPIRPAPAKISLVIVVAMMIGWAVSYVASGTFASRYASIVFPLFALLIAAGLIALPPKLRYILTGIVVAGSMVGIAYEIRDSRTQAQMAAEAIAKSGAEDPLIVSCPDQLAVSLDRAAGGAYEVVVFPDVNRDPRFVDWVDYAERNAAADPVAFVADVDRLAGDRPIMLAVNLTYKTLESQCGKVAAILQSQRPGSTIVAGDGTTYFESMSVMFFPAKGS